MITLLMGMLLVTLPGPTVAAGHPATSWVLSSSASGTELTTARDDAQKEETYHVPVVLNESVEAYIEFFTTRGKSMFQQWLNNSARYLPVMKEIFRKENLPEELVYVAMIESGFDPRAVSRAKAAGPWQFMPDTARQYGLRNDWWVDERKDDIKSTRAAARYFRALHERLGSWALVLASYNAGMGKVQHATLRTGTTDFWDLEESAYLRRETKNFVPKFMAAALIARDPAAYGFRVPAVEQVRYDEVVIQESMDLGIVAYSADSSTETIRSLNPELNVRSTPPDDRRYVLKIPEGKTRTFWERNAAIRRAAILIPREHKVYLSDLRRIGSGGEFRNGRDTCSIFDTTAVLVNRSFQPAVPGNTVRKDYLALAERDESMHTERPLMVCIAQTHPVGVNQYLGPREFPFLNNTRDPRR